MGEAENKTERKEPTLAKLERMKKTLRRQEPDMVPISDFFWGGFTEGWKKDLRRLWPR